MADQYIDSVALLCHFEQTRTATYIYDTSKTLWDSATASCVGTTALSSTQKKFGATSLKTGNANGNYWRYPPLKLMDFGSGDFTLETHMWPVSQGTDYGAILGRWDDSVPANRDLLLWRAADGSVNVSVNGAQVVTGAAGDLPTGAFAHVALTRQGNTLTVWVEGVAKGSGSLSGAINCTPTQAFTLGQSAFGGGSTWLEAYYDELRVTVGVCRYTAGFTAPTAQCDDYPNTVLQMHFDQRLGTLTWLDSSRFARRMQGTPATPPALNSSTVKFGNSAFFTGSPAYIYSLDAPELNFGPNDFCVEGWFYTTVVTGTALLCSKSVAGADSFRIFRQNNQIGGYLSTNGAAYTQQILSAAGAISVNTWYHVALVRFGTTISLYLNGVLVGTAAIAAGLALVNSTDSVYFGGNANTFYHTGYLDEWRIVTGSPVYYGAFTPPTAPFADPPPLVTKTLASGRVLTAWKRTPASLTPVVSRPTPLHLRSRDTAFGGVGSIAGQVTINQTPASRKVRLLDRTSGQLVQEQWSQDDGSYAFSGIDETRKYTALSYDHQNTYNAVVQDNITPAAPAYPVFTNQKYKRTVRVTAAGAGLGTNYPVLIRLGESIVAPASDMPVLLKRFPTGKDDNNPDILFTDAGGTPLDFWLEQVVGTTPNRTAYYYVRLPGDLDAGPQDVVVTYYGATPAKTSNGANTFPMLWDDFNYGPSVIPDASKWTFANGAGGFVWLNTFSIMQVQGRSSYVDLRSLATFGPGTEILAKQTVFAGTGIGAGNIDVLLGFATGATGTPTAVVSYDRPGARSTQQRLAINNEADSVNTGDFTSKVAPQRVQLAWGADGSARLAHDEVVTKTRTGVVGSGPAGISIRTWGPSESTQQDYIMVRKYIPGGTSLTLSAETVV